MIIISSNVQSSKQNKQNNNSENENKIPNKFLNSNMKNSRCLIALHPMQIVKPL